MIREIEGELVSSKVVKENNDLQWNVSLVGSPAITYGMLKWSSSTKKSNKSHTKKR
jgi:hypothetical protein